MSNSSSKPMTADIVSALRGGALRSVRPVLQDLPELAAQEIERLICERDEALAHEGQKDARIEELLSYLHFDGVSHRDWVADCQTLEAECNNWKESAAAFARNMEYYQGLVDRIGRAIGPEAYTAEDGSKSDDVLRAKVPEIIERLLSGEPT